MASDSSEGLGSGFWGLNGCPVWDCGISGSRTLRL